MNSENQSNSYETIEFVDFDKKITKELIKDFLNSKNIEFESFEFINNPLENLQNIRIKVNSDSINLTRLEVIKGDSFPNFDHQKISIKFLIKIEESLDIDFNPKEDEVIEYPYKYHQMIHTDFTRTVGQSGLIFKNTTIIEKQRAVVSYLVKNAGLNLLKGKSIMNVSLPINIFDCRSLLEVFVSQTCYAPVFLEKAGTAQDKIEALKLTSSFAISTVHLAVAQLKPFNPILGETFQAKVNGSEFYVEQTSHHPPIFNFLYMGQNYKVHGYNQSDVSTGANSVKAKYKGKYTIELKNGITHYVYFPEFQLSGTLIGDRAIKYTGKMIICDEKNDLICNISMEPDDRGFFKKMFSKKSTFPDYFNGLITNISSNTKADKEHVYKIKDPKKNVICNIEGEFSSFLEFEGEKYWEYSKLEYPEFKRMKFTLRSDSTFRDDIVWIKKGNEEKAQKFKIKLEDIQRNDKKLRIDNEKLLKNETKKKGK